MQDEESRDIRDAVIRALADEGADVSGFVGAQEALERVETVALPVWQGGVDTAFGQRVSLAAAGGSADDVTAPTPSNGATEDAAPSEAQVEGEMLEAVLADVRAQSAEGRLVEPARWPEAGLVPGHQSAEEWEMFVYEFLEEQKRKRAAQPQPVVASARSATKAVGIPRAFRVEAPEPQGPPDAAAAPEPQGPSDAAAAPDAAAPPELPDTLESAESAAVAPLCHPERSDVVAESKDPAARNSADAPSTPDASAPDAPACDDIAVLMGARSYYLYSRDRMSDAYAHWAFLASEDDRVATFVDCVREESRTYPRPLEAKALTRKPFRFTSDDVTKLWDLVRESGSYPDIATVSASNGDVYYYSTDYLSPALAESLAEWNSVERQMYL